MWRPDISLPYLSKPKPQPAFNSTGVILTAGVAGFALATLVYSAYRKQVQHRQVYPGSAPMFRQQRQARPDTLAGKTVLINRPRAELYEFWKNFNNLPQFMENVESVQVDGDITTWQIAAPAGHSVKLVTRLIEDVADERLAWRSTEESEVRTEGYVAFRDAPGGRGTLVEARFAYTPPGGQIGRAIAHLFRKAPEVQARHELKRFKMLMETGEIANSARTRSQAKG